MAADLTPSVPPGQFNGRPSWLAANRKSVILGGILLALLLGSVAAAMFRRPPAEPTNQNFSATLNINQAIVNTSPAQTRPTAERFPVVATGDEDGDGLSDADEATAGTNVQKNDTDGDGLNDYEEVKVYKTQPTVADSDHDGHPDGQEVYTGFNPLGTGLLRDLPRAIEQLPKN